MIRVARAAPSPIEGTSASSRSRQSYFDFFAGALVFVDFFAGAVFSVAFAAFLAVAILELLKQGLPMGITNSSGKPKHGGAGTAGDSTNLCAISSSEFNRLEKFMTTARRETPKTSAEAVRRSNSTSATFATDHCPLANHEPHIRLRGERPRERHIAAGQQISKATCRSTSRQGCRDKHGNRQEDRRTRNASHAQHGSTSGVN